MEIACSIFQACLLCGQIMLILIFTSTPMRLFADWPSFRCPNIKPLAINTPIQIES